jgi:hypothetical protein
MHDGEEPSCGGGLWRRRGGGGQRWELAMLRPLRALRGWPVRARGAGGWCGGAFCTRRWYSVRGRSGRGERVQCSAEAAAGVHGGPVRARGAGGCCGGALCVRRWYSVRAG